MLDSFDADTAVSASYNSPFSRHAEQLIAAGYSPLPIKPGKKKPDLTSWSQAAEEQMNENLLKHFIQLDRHGLGVACGYQGLIAIDIDTEDQAIMDAVRTVLPESTVAKRGKKGRTDFYRAAGEIETARLDASGVRIVEILASGTQTVIGPTIHPDTKMPYAWLTQAALWQVKVEGLPVITPDHVERLLVALEQWTGKAAKPAKAKSGETPASRGSRHAAYAPVALAGRCADLEKVPDGGRNTALFNAACYLGKYVHHGIISRAEVTARLMDACRKNGLFGEEGEDACQATIDSGLDKAEGDPLPELEDRPHQVQTRPANGGKAVATQGIDAKIIGAATQDDIAIAFVRKADGRLRYCHTQGAWFFWTDRYWQRDERMLAFHYARNVSREQSMGLGEDEQKAIRRATFAGGVERFGRADPAIAATYATWDADPWLLGTPNGTVDLRTGELRAPDPADCITRITAVPPSAEADCPAWLSFLHDATKGDSAFIRFLQQICGYCLTGVVREHVVLFFYGPGGNGKSTFLKVLTDILSAYAVTAAMTTFTAAPYEQHPTDLAMLRGARLVSASETEAGRKWAKARIQQMTGGDPITARFMRQDFFTYMPQFKPIIVGNHAPQLASVDDAIRRRFNVIPFTHKPEHPDAMLGERLRGEYSGILQWMIEGCLDWRDNGLMVPPVVADETERYLKEQEAGSETFSDWLEKRCILEPGNGRLSEAASDLYDSWRTYSSLHGEDTGSKIAFGKALDKAGCVPRKTEKARFWDGIGLKRPAPETAS